MSVVLGLVMNVGTSAAAPSTDAAAAAACPEPAGSYDISARRSDGAVAEGTVYFYNDFGTKRVTSASKAQLPPPFNWVAIPEGSGNWYVDSTCHLIFQLSNSQGGFSRYRSLTPSYDVNGIKGATGYVEATGGSGTWAMSRKY
ncbi:hypothetical protein [Lentzea sp. HUAS12]|uniref:hypothetical protein n=1 Tax=Lentzea sp. HUAS12 TaxID=2951806 RepID=UPI00209DFC4E|nr:hypothetical protein [Lentzea sp. HUAS12]USX56375.1 hypothetical protein ND450_20410 [Lentzea sp. HUAS12]